jgi:hypothetical protein
MGRTYTQSCLQNAVETALTLQTRLQKSDFALRPARARLANMLYLKLRHSDIAV